MLYFIKTKFIILRQKLRIIMPIDTFTSRPQTPIVPFDSLQSKIPESEIILSVRNCRCCLLVTPDRVTLLSKVIKDSNEVRFEYKKKTYKIFVLGSGTFLVRATTDAQGMTKLSVVKDRALSEFPCCDRFFPYSPYLM